MTPVQAGSHHYAEYGAIVVVGLATVIAVFVMMSLVQIITRRFNKIPDSAMKKTTYECGETPVGTGWFRFNNRFYLVAILFLVFDVEIALLMPILSRYTTFLQEGNGGAGLLKIALFVGTLLFGLVYAAYKGDLSWNKSIRTSPEEP